MQNNGKIKNASIIIINIQWTSLTKEVSPINLEMKKKVKRVRNSLNVGKLNAKNFTILILHFTTIVRKLTMDSFLQARYSMGISLMARPRTGEGLELKKMK